jgi:hypothetical protein
MGRLSRLGESPLRVGIGRVEACWWQLTSGGGGPAGSWPGRGATGSSIVSVSVQVALTTTGRVRRIFLCLRHPADKRLGHSRWMNNRRARDEATIAHRLIGGSGVNDRHEVPAGTTECGAGRVLWFLHILLRACSVVPLGLCDLWACIIPTVETVGYCHGVPAGTCRTGGVACSPPPWQDGTPQWVPCLHRAAGQACPTCDERPICPPCCAMWTWHPAIHDMRPNAHVPR